MNLSPRTVLVPISAPEMLAVLKAGAAFQLKKAVLPIIEQRFDLTPMARQLMKLEKDLKQAQASGNRKARGKIYKLLVDISPAEFIEFLRLINGKVMDTSGTLATCLAKSFTEHSLADRLFYLFCGAAFGEVREKDDSELFIATLLHWLGNDLQFSSSLVKKAMADDTLREDLVFLIFFCLKRMMGFQTAAPGDSCFLNLDGPDPQPIFAWPLMPIHRQWVDALIPPVYEQYRLETAHLEQIENLEPDWKVIDNLWQSIEQDAIYGLHQDGDEIEFRFETMKLYRLPGVTLQKSQPFPCAKVILHVDTFGLKQNPEGRLADGRLDIAADHWCPYGQWLVTLAILAGYHQIITGEEPDDEPWYAKCGKNKTGAEPIERRAAKPHFYSLQPGHRASEEAKAACLYHFGRELAPGKTFRAGKKTVVCAKRKISAIVTPHILSRHAADLVSLV